MKTAKIQVKEYNDDALIKRLRKNPKELDAYISYIAKEYDKDKDLDSFLDCLKVAVIASRGTATNIAKVSGIDRSGIYKALSNHTKPRIDTLLAILNGIGFDMSFVRIKKVA